jgi:hypothetical protein
LTASATEEVPVSFVIRVVLRRRWVNGHSANRIAAFFHGRRSAPIRFVMSLRYGHDAPSFSPLFRAKRHPKARTKT